MSSMNDMPVWPGWETVRLIGRGSYGAVYEIEKDNFGKKDKAALKVISIPQNESEIDELYYSGYDSAGISKKYKECLAGIVREYNLMSEMKGNTNIVSCDDNMCYPHSDGIGWDVLIKMELLTPLLKILPAVINERGVIKLGRDICGALRLCEKKNIIHRDIKPQNIFVSKNWDFKLGDFGVARTIEGTVGATVAGTPPYMAPEVYRHQPYNHQADIYSLGLVLYWLLNDRRLPFLPMPPEVPTKTENEDAIIRRMNGEPLPAPKNGSRELKSIVLKACAFEKAKRYLTADEMLADLDALQKGEYRVNDEIADGSGMTGSNDCPGINDGFTMIPDAGEKTVGIWFGNEPVKTEQNQPKKLKSKKRIAILAALIAALAIAAAFVFAPAVEEKNVMAEKYASAVALLNDEKYEEAISAFKSLEGYEDSADQIEACRSALKNRDYRDAVSLMSEGKYVEAISAFEAMDGYGNSAQQIEVCRTALKNIDYKAAVSLMGEEKYEEAITAFEALGGYSDSAVQIEACRSALRQIEKEAGYEAAVGLAIEEKYEEAISAFIALGGYKDSKERSERLQSILPFISANVGDIVTFGKYEQDNNKKNGMEDIQWLVLDKKNGKLLVISKYALDYRPYNEKRSNITWEECDLRAWLNDTFLNTTFSAEDQGLIEKTVVTADKSRIYVTDPGNETEDRIFLLSSLEAEKYFSTNELRRCAPSKYATTLGITRDYNAWTLDKETACTWWLRSPGKNKNSAEVIYSSGANNYSATTEYKCGIRPAMWIDLDY